MPFGTITSQTKTYDPRSPGVYSLSTLAFGDPSNEYRVAGATLGKDKILRATVSRVLQKDVVEGSNTLRKQCVVQLSVAVPPSGFTSAEVDSLVEDISVFLTAGVATRLLSGES